MRRTLLLLLLLPLGACAGQDDPVPQLAEPAPSTPTSAAVSPSGSATPAPDPDTPSWKPARRLEADLDGDGSDEEVLMGGELGRIRVAATLSGDGDVVATHYPMTYVSWWPEGVTDMDGDGAEEVVLTIEAAKQRPRVLVVQDGQFVEVPRQQGAPLAYGPTAGPEHGTAYALDWWVADGQVHSSRSVETYPLTSHVFDLPTDATYDVDAWSWRIRDGRMRPHREGVYCVPPGRPHPLPCARD